MSVVAGIDGCPGGWLCVSWSLDVDRLEPHLLSRIGQVAALDPRPDSVMIDIPIDLMRSGSRQCNLEARVLLGWPRSSSVFPALIHPVLAARSSAEACSIGMKNERKKLSRQSWAILGKVHEVDMFLRSNPECQGWIREVHPAVSFGKDDLIDAFAALWTAEQAHSGKALVLPPNPPPDEYGLRMEIVA